MSTSTLERSPVRKEEDADRHQSGVYSLIRDMDESIREQRDSLHDFRRETGAHFKFVERDMGLMKAEITSVKSSVVSVQGTVSLLKEEVSDVKGDVKALNARVDGVDQRLEDLRENQNKWFMLLGILVGAMPIVIPLIQKYIK